MTDDKTDVTVDENGEELSPLQKMTNMKHELQRLNDRLVMDIKELETQLADERHDFRRKQIGMSTLVTVLMRARFGEGQPVYIDRDELVRLASEAAATNEDNAMLRKELDDVQDELRVLRAHTMTHKMALQESTGIKLAELIHQRDNLKAALIKQTNAATDEETMAWINEIMAKPLVKDDDEHVELPSTPLVPSNPMSPKDPR